MHKIESGGWLALFMWQIYRNSSNIVSLCAAVFWTCIYSCTLLHIHTSSKSVKQNRIAQTLILLAMVIFSLIITVMSSYMQTTAQTWKYLITPSQLLLPFCSFCRMWQEVECQLMLIWSIKLRAVKREGCVQLEHQELEPALLYLTDGETIILTWKPGIRYAA